ncbi:MAG TPA: hypothetical protein VMW18_16165 [Candidatus Binatia bacterium]|nr:hypothetical protein [Candidatus Binatia bacterium]
MLLTRLSFTQCQEGLSFGDTFLGKRATRDFHPANCFGMALRDKTEDLTAT